MEGMQIPFTGGYESIGTSADIKQRMDLFYAYMDENNYKEADKVLTEMEAIVGTTDPDIAAARTSGFGENIGGIVYDCYKKGKNPIVFEIP